MTFETLNSVYSVAVTDDGKFQVTKIREISESPFNAVGAPRISAGMFLQIGSRAQFDTWSTSRVTSIYEASEK